ncbi:MAG: diguanylate cyclase [Gammaproteobacteria bacterium]|nr:diguanylate cyclase [Gammaproteobacteria bacterium]
MFEPQPGPFLSDNRVQPQLPIEKTPTFSMGITILTESDQKITDAISRADKALYQAKESGRNRVITI